MTEKRYAVALSGGDLKGAWQAGALHGFVSRTQIAPSFVGGISVGALNTGMLATFAGRMRRKALAHGIPLEDTETASLASKALFEFWRANVTRPSQFVAKRGVFDLATRLLTKRWAGLSDMSGLRKTLEQHLDPEAVRAAPFEAKVGAVSLETGALTYFDLKDERDPHAAIMASTAIPVMMPPVAYLGQHWVDGGIRDNAPLRPAIDSGADHILVIATDPDPFPAPEKDWEAGDAMGQISRAMQIVVDELLRADIARVEQVNAEVLAGTAKPGHRYINLTVLRPKALLPVRSVTKFNAEDVQAMLADGFSVGFAA